MIVLVITRTHLKSQALSHLFADHKPLNGVGMTSRPVHTSPLQPYPQSSGSLLKRSIAPFKNFTHCFTNL